MSVGQIALLALISSRAAALGVGADDAFLVERVYQALVTNKTVTIPGSAIELLLLIDSVVSDEARKDGSR